MVEKLPERVSRKELVRAEPDFFQAFKNFFSEKLQREIDLMQHAIDHTFPKLKDMILSLDTDEETRMMALHDFHKLSHAVDYYSWLHTFVDLIESGEIFHVLKK
jgi:DNA-binding transcriptional regulator GbsR (MarR family)